MVGWWVWVKRLFNKERGRGPCVSWWTWREPWSPRCRTRTWGRAAPVAPPLAESQTKLVGLSPDSSRTSPPSSSRDRHRSKSDEANDGKSPKTQTAHCRGEVRARWLCGHLAAEAGVLAVPVAALALQVLLLHHLHKCTLHTAPQVCSTLLC